MSEATTKQGVCSAGTIRDALRQMRKVRKGSLLITSGLSDLRLVLGAGKLALEGVGVEFDGEEDRDLIRAFLCALFWTEASYFLDLEGTQNASFAGIRLNTTNIYPILDQIEQGLKELDDLRARVANIDLMVSVRGTPPPNDIDSPSANLFRVLVDQPRGGHLGASADEAGLDEIDAVWAVVDLLDDDMATVKRPPPTMAVRRLKRSELFAGEGMIPAVRYQHIARGYARIDPKKAGYLQQEAGTAFLTAGMPEQALSAFKAGLESAPESISGLEGTVSALEALRRTSDARFVRERLILLYKDWHLPARTLRHLETISDRSPEQEELRLEAYLQLEDFDGALEAAKAILPKLDTPGRLKLVKRFAQHGAQGKSLDRIIRLSKTQSLRPVRKLLFLVVALLAIATTVVGGEVFGLRTRFHAARLATLDDLREGKIDGLLDHWKELIEIREQLVAKGLPVPPQTCLSALAQVTTDLEAIQADHALLKDPQLARSFSWRGYRDTRDADNLLAKLEKQAKSAALKALVKKVRTEIATYWEAIEGKLATVKRTTNREQAFELQRALLLEHSNAPHLLRQLEVALALQVTPPGPEVKVRWRGKQLRASSSGEWEIKLPLALGSAGDLRVERPKYVPDQQRLVLQELVRSKVEVDLFLLEAVPPGIPQPTSEKLKGLDVVWTLEWDKGKGKALVPRLPTEPGPLAPLADELRGSDPGLLLRVQALGVARPNAANRPPRVYLSGFRVWVDNLSKGTAATPRRINLKGAILPGRSWRPVKQGEGYALEPLTEVKGFDRILAAIRHVVRLQIEELK